MKFYKSAILLLLIAKCLWAGLPREINENDPRFTGIGLSVDAEVYEKDKQKLLVKVSLIKKALKSKDIKVTLRYNKQNNEISPSIKADNVKLSFVIDKKDIADAKLYITFYTGKSCPPSYFLKLITYKNINKLISPK